MKIIIDAMGGDNAPDEIVRGALHARKELGVALTLVGQREPVLRCLAENGAAPGEGLELVEADEIVTMEDDPSTAVRRKRNSSMSVALRLLRDGAGDAVVSAGSTGALLSGATLVVKRVHGIRRAALAPVLPNRPGTGMVLIDCGANVECTPEYLLQFAFMGSFYAERFLNIPRPKVGLLNVGSEDTKGGELQKQTFALLHRAGEQGQIHFVGNTEADRLLTGEVDVLVADGFSGNILLKSTEGSVKFLMRELKGVMLRSMRTRLGALMLRGGIAGLRRRMDANEVGGTALLGISKPVIKAHGSSNAAAVAAAVRQAVRFAEADVVGEIGRNIELMRLPEETEATA